MPLSLGQWGMKVTDLKLTNVSTMSAEIQVLVNEIKKSVSINFIHATLYFLEVYENSCVYAGRMVYNSFSKPRCIKWINGRQVSKAIIDLVKKDKQEGLFGIRGKKFVGMTTAMNLTIEY
jgi:hypothetical protein